MPAVFPCRALFGRCNVARTAQDSLYGSVWTLSEDQNVKRIVFREKGPG